MISSIDNKTFKYKRQNIISVLKNKPLEIDIRKLSDNRLEKEMNKFQTLMNKRGEEMVEKVENIWYLVKDI